MESIISNACDAVGDSHRGQTAATVESITCYGFYAIRYRICSGIRGRHKRKYMSIINRRGQTFATIESIISNACDAIANRHGGQTGAIFESIFPNTRDAVGYRHRGQTAAFIESITSNTCYAIANRHRGQTAAIRESLISNACDAIGNCNRSQSTAILESMISNACDGICLSSISYRSRNIGCGDSPICIILIIIFTTFVCDLCRLVGGIEVVIQIADLDFFCKNCSYAGCYSKQ